MRKTWTLSLALAVPLALAACGGSAPAGTTTGGGEQSGGTIKIGSLHPLSGSSAADGQQMDNGAKLAVEAINNAGGIKSQGGKKLELVSADTQGKPEVGQSEAQRLIQEGAVGLVGTYQSAVSANVSTVSERNKVPFVIDVSSADSILAQGYKYTFRRAAQLHRARHLGRAVPRPGGEGGRQAGQDRRGPARAGPVRHRRAGRVQGRGREGGHRRSARRSPTTRPASPT